MAQFFQTALYPPSLSGSSDPKKSGINFIHLLEAKKTETSNDTNKLCFCTFCQVFVGSQDGKVYALNQDTGMTSWSSSFLGGTVESSPAVAEDKVFIGCNNGTVYALSQQTGDVIWQNLTGGTVKSSPAVVDGVVYVGSFDTYVYAFNATNGNPVWLSPHETEGDIECSPAVANDMVFVGSWDKKIYALDAFAGTLKWIYPTEGRVRSSPVVAGGVVFVGSDDMNIYALKSSNGELVWKVKLGGAVRSSPTVAYDLAFVGANDNYVYALNQTNGKVVWKYKTEGAVESSSAVAEAEERGLILVGSRDWKLYALSKNGGLYWSYQTGGEIVSSPAILNGMVFIGSNDKKVYAFKEIPDYAVHDVAAISRIGHPEPYVFEPYRSVTSQPYTFHVYVIVENQGTYTESFNVTLYISGEEKGKQLVNELMPGTTRTLAFTINSLDLAFGNDYQISATADTVPEEIDLSDNNYFGGWIRVTFPGDIDGIDVHDEYLFEVELADLVLFARAYGSIPCDPNWNPNADINNDGIIGLLDLVILAQHYGQHHP